jgi:methylated-DNA-[protein]-cysteine S-methyltransferase
LKNKLLKNIKGTNFQIQVWTEITKIPFGMTKTYKEIAVSIGKPNSARAVANACGKNPYPVDIPCHRVVRSDGNIGGYSGVGGQKKKIELLKAENFKF